MNKRFSFTKIDNTILDYNDITRAARAVFSVLARHASQATPDSFRTCFSLRENYKNYTPRISYREYNNIKI